MANLEIKTATRYIEVFLDGVFVSRHLTVEDAIESAVNRGNGDYRIVYPERLVKVYGILNPQVGDTQAPTVPGNPQLVSKGANFVTLSWSPSTDNIGVTGYQIRRGGAPIATTASTSYTNSGLTPSTQYSYTVEAFDAAGNNSGTAGQTPLVTTTNANAAPVWNAPQQELTTNVSYNLVLTSVCSDADTNPLTFALVSGTLPTGVTFNAGSGIVSGTPTVVEAPSVTFSASDGIVAPVNQAIVFNVLNPDVTAPPVPTMSAVSSITASGATVSCGSVTDTTVANARTSGGVQYIFQRATDSGFTTGVVTEAAQSGTSKALTGLAAGTLYYFRVRAQDAAGNQSAFSVAVHAVTANQSTMYFQDGGETGNTSPWGFVGGDGTSPTYETSGGGNGNAYAGTRFMSWVLDNSVGGDDHALVYEAAGTPTAPNPTVRNGFLQYAVSYGGTFGLASGEIKQAIIQFYRQSSPSFSNANRKYQIVPVVRSNGQYAVVCVEMDDAGSFLRQSFITQGGTPVGPANAANGWDVIRIEWQLDTNGSQVANEYGVGFGNGIVRMWRNNTLICEATNVNICRGETVVAGRAFCTSHHGAFNWNGGTQNVYYDQFQFASAASALTAMPTSTIARIPASGPGTADLFTADYGSELGNWDTYVGGNRVNIDYSRTRVAGGGPRGLDAIDLNMLVGAADEQYWGWRKTIANQAAGEWRYYRYYYRPHANNNYQASDGGRIVNKTLILGDSGSGSRLIWNVQGIRNDGPQISCIFDGGPVLDTNEVSSPYTDGQWMALQLGVRWGSGQSQIKIWINNDNFASPTLQTSASLSFTNTLNGEISFGSYHNDGMTTGGVFSKRLAAFRVATTFDSSWYNWMIG